MRFNQEEFEEYITENYGVLFEGELEGTEDLPGHCEFCKRDVFLKLYKKKYNTSYTESLPYFEILHIECPNCRRKSFIHSVVIDNIIEGGDGNEHDVRQHFRLFNLPDRDYSYELSDIPDEYDLLKKCVSEAMFCMGHSKYTSATIMFRRAIQIIAHNILAAPKGNLARQLKWLKNNENALKIDLTEVFHENSEIIKGIGNQGAHPEDEISLQEFTQEEMNLLHDLFQSTITEIFIKPARLKEIQEDLKSKRKIN